MKAYLDSSALVKRYIRERGSESVSEVCAQSDEMGVSVIGYPEILSAFCRLRREGKLSGQQYTGVKQALTADLADSVLLNVNETVLMHSLALLEENSLRAMDSLHIASALTWKADLFVSGDAEQIHAARRAGLAVKTVS